MSSFASKFSVLKKDELPEGAIAIAGRVSTEEMAKGDSIENQIEACRNFCAAHPDVFGDREVRVYTDPGHTGTTFDRPGINNFRADKEKIRIACILVRDLKRLGRNAKEGLEFLDDITAAKIQLIDIGQPAIDYTTTKGRKIFTDAMSSAEAECGIYRDSSIQGQTRRAQKGQWKGGPPPYAYDLEAGMLRPVFGPATELLQKMATLYEEHKSYIRVLAELNKLGLKFAPITPRVLFDAERARRGFVSRRPENSGKPQLITLRWIQAMLQNPVYAGYVPAPRAVNDLTVSFKPDLILPDGRRYFKSMHQAILPLPLWEKLQAIRRGQAKTQPHVGRPSPDYLLQGLLHCGCCQLPLHVGAATSGSKKTIRHYACRSMKRLGSQSKCTVRRVPAEAMETAIMRYLSDLPKRPEIINDITALAGKNKEGLTAGMQERITNLEKERAALERTKKAAIDRMLEFTGKKIAIEMERRYNEVQAKLDAVIAELADLRRKLEAAEAAAPSTEAVASALADFGKMAARLPALAVKELVQLLVAEVVVRRLDRHSIPRYRQLPANSSVLQLDVTLNPCGLHMTSSPSKGKSSARTKGSQPKLVPTTLIVEIRQAGNKGNVVRLLEPFATEAEMYAFPSTETPAEDVARSKHPLWRMEAMLAMRGKGMLKKDIAAKYGKKPSWVTYHFRLTGLLSGIKEKLKSSPLNVLDQFGLVYLMKLAAMAPSLQGKVFDEAFRKALHTDPAAEGGARSRRSTERRLTHLTPT